MDDGIDVGEDHAASAPDGQVVAGVERDSRKWKPVSAAIAL
jgi:hypothetical protein